MGVSEKLAKWLGYRRLDAANKGFRPTDHFPPHIKWMEFFGDNCSPGFNVELNSFNGLKRSYIKCSPVSTIINRLSASMKNGKLWILEEGKDGNDISKRYADLYNLLKNPNPLQTWTDFIEQIDLFRNLYGVTYIHSITPIGFHRIDSMALWPVSPELITTKYKYGVSYHTVTQIEDLIEHYEITTDSGILKVEPSNILRIRDSQLENKKEISRLSGLEDEVENIIQAQNAIRSLNKDRGAMGMITNATKDSSGSIPLKPAEKKQIEEAYQNTFGITSGKYKMLISESDLDFKQMTFSVKDLMLFEGVKQNIERIADAYNYPFHLLANEKGTTFNNVSGFQRYLYQDNIIPSGKNYAEKLTKFFGLEGARIDIDFSDVVYLKESKKDDASAKRELTQALEAPYRSGVITREEYRAELDMNEQPEGATFYNDGNNE